MNTTTNIIKPTVGRIVWYWPSAATQKMCNLSCNDPLQPMAAVISYVWHDRMVNLHVIDHAGMEGSITSVSLIQPGDDVPEGRDYCQWMPYQQQQTRKDAAATSTQAAALAEVTPVGTSLEQAIREAGADVSPRVTLEDIEAHIDSEHYFTAENGVRGASMLTESGADLRGAFGVEVPLPLNLLTFCVLVLRNGYTVYGDSACASPENFNADIGRRIARENAIAKVSPLLGYELRNQIYRAACLKSEQAQAEPV